MQLQHWSHCQPCSNGFCRPRPSNSAAAGWNTTEIHSGSLRRGWSYTDCRPVMTGFTLIQVSVQVSLHWLASVALYIVNSITLRECYIMCTLIMPSLLTIRIWNQLPAVVVMFPSIEASQRLRRLYRDICPVFIYTFS